MDEAAVADKENEEPGAKKGSLFSNGKHGKGKSKTERSEEPLRPDGGECNCCCQR